MVNDDDVPREVPGPRTDRRAAGESDRRYNRRSTTSEVAPPYHATFERIAAALEGIERTLTSRAVDLRAASDEDDPESTAPPGR